MNEVQEYILNKAMQKVANGMDKEAKSLGSYIYDEIIARDIPKHIGHHVNKAWNSAKRFFNFGDETIQIGNKTMEPIHLPGQQITDAALSGLRKAYTDAGDLTTLKIPNTGNTEHDMNRILQQIQARKKRMSGIRATNEQIPDPVEEFFDPVTSSLYAKVVSPGSKRHGRHNWGMGMDEVENFTKLYAPKK